jgi:hypothetical protein
VRPARIAVVGSGPSLLQADLSRLREVDSIAFNRSYLAYEDWGLHPTFYSCIDRNALPENRQAIAELIVGARVRRLFLRDTARRLGLPESERVTFVHVGEHMRFSLDLDDLGMFGNVAAVSIQILAALGYRRFLLLGVDGNYHMSRPAAQLESPYDLLAQADDDPDHFRPDYHGANVRFTRPNNRRFLAGWEELARQARGLGLEIVNASPTSAVESFPKLAFEEAWAWFQS